LAGSWPEFSHKLATRNEGGTRLGPTTCAFLYQRVSTLVWDTTEVPSGITFNPATQAAATVAADLPNLG
jgi:hypothetical protein